MKDKQKIEIDSYKQVIEQFASQIDKKEKTLQEKESKIKSQSHIIKEQTEKIENFEKKEMVNRIFGIIRNWIRFGNYYSDFIIFIKSSNSNGDIISVVLGELGILGLIFGSWWFSHKSKLKK